VGNTGVSLGPHLHFGVRKSCGHGDTEFPGVDSLDLDKNNEKLYSLIDPFGYLASCYMDNHKGAKVMKDYMIKTNLINNNSNGNSHPAFVKYNKNKKNPWKMVKPKKYKGKRNNKAYSKKRVTKKRNQPDSPYKSRKGGFF